MAGYTFILCYKAKLSEVEQYIINQDLLKYNKKKRLYNQLIFIKTLFAIYFCS